MKMKLPLTMVPNKKQNQIHPSMNLNKKLAALSTGFTAGLVQSDDQNIYPLILTAFKLRQTHAPMRIDMAFTALRLQRYDHAYA